MCASVQFLIHPPIAESADLVECMLHRLITPADRGEWQLASLANPRPSTSQVIACLSPTG
jgi:hypothetical protein